MAYAVRIIYPGRTGKRDLIVMKETRAAAVNYAKKVARKGFSKAGRRHYKTGVRWNAPKACIYDLGKWTKRAPTCYRAFEKWMGAGPTVRRTNFGRI